MIKNKQKIRKGIGKLKNLDLWFIAPGRSKATSGSETEPPLLYIRLGFRFKGMSFLILVELILVYLWAIKTLMYV